MANYSIPINLQVNKLGAIDYMNFKAFWDDYCSDNLDYLDYILPAAIPEVLLPDMLNKMWINFFPKQKKGSAFSRMMTSDIIFSPLCEPIATGIYIMRPAIREVLIKYYKTERCRLVKINDVAKFVLGYVPLNTAKIPLKAMQEAVKWSANSYVKPQKAVEQIHKLINSYSEKRDYQSKRSLYRYITVLERNFPELLDVPSSGEKGELFVYLSLGRSIREYYSGDIIECEQIIEKLNQFVRDNRSQKGISVSIPSEILQKIRYQDIIISTETRIKKLYSKLTICYCLNEDSKRQVQSILELPVYENNELISQSEVVYEISKRKRLLLSILELGKDLSGVFDHLVFTESNLTIVALKVPKDGQIDRNSVVNWINRVQVEAGAVDVVLFVINESSVVFSERDLASISARIKKVVFSKDKKAKDKILTFIEKRAREINGDILKRWNKFSKSHGSLVVPLENLYSTFNAEAVEWLRENRSEFWLPKGEHRDNAIVKLPELIKILSDFCLTERFKQGKGILPVVELDNFLANKNIIERELLINILETLNVGYKEDESEKMVFPYFIGKGEGIKIRDIKEEKYVLYDFQLFNGNQFFYFISHLGQKDYDISFLSRNHVQLKNRNQEDTLEFFQTVRDAKWTLRTKASGNYIERFHSEVEKFLNSFYFRSNIERRVFDSFSLNHPELIKVEGGYLKVGDIDKLPEIKEVENIPEKSILVKDFEVDKYQMTYNKYKIYCKINKLPLPQTKWMKRNMPVVSVNWKDIIKYCNWLSEVFGYEKVYTLKKNKIGADWNANGFRLPTHIEWEYAARGGLHSESYLFSGSNKISDVAWCNVNSGNKVHPVGLKHPNELGVFDMSGNVNEWCFDHYYPKREKQIEAYPKESGKRGNKILKGGAFRSQPKSCEVTFKRAYHFENRGEETGFRVFRNVVDAI